MRRHHHPLGDPNILSVASARTRATGAHRPTESPQSQPEPSGSVASVAAQSQARSPPARPPRARGRLAQPHSA